MATTHLQLAFRPISHHRAAAVFVASKSPLKSSLVHVNPAKHEDSKGKIRTKIDTVINIASFCIREKSFAS